MTSIFNSNARNNATITVGAIQASVDNARKSFALSKDSASMAAAHAYLVWLDTQSSSAPEHMRTWLVEQIDALNTAIDQHNDNEVELKDRATRIFKGEKLKKNDALNIDPKDEEERKQQDAERAELKKLGGQTAEQWQARRKVRIERRNDASAFTEIVKYVFGFDRRADASVTARYAKVLEWIATRFHVVAPHDAGEIVEAIKAAGGFEDALHEQRGLGADEEDDEEAEDRKVQAAAIVTDAKNAVAGAKAKAVFDMDVQNAPEGIVTLLARYVNGKVEVVGELPISDKQLNHTVSMFDDETLLPTYHRSEFVSRVLALGELVKEGDKTSKKVDDLKAGAALKAERVLSLLPNGAAGVQLVMSARYADASTIIKATPSKPPVDLGVVNTPVTLAVESRKLLRKVIRDRGHRRLVDIVPQINGGEVQWVATDRALIAENRSNGSRLFVFDDMTAEAHKPLDVDGFRPQFKVTVTSAELSKLYDARLKAWAESVNGKKHQKLMELTFANGTLAYKVTGEDDFAMPCAGVIVGAVSLKFRPRDLHDLIEALKGQHTEMFEVSGDTGGMMCISWTDGLGAYEVFQPTATADGVLNIKRVEEMRCEVALPNAA
jgi:hypothetical protein